MINTEYVKKASLDELIGDRIPDSKIIDVVCLPTGYSHAELLKALEVVETALCPWPSRRISKWFWDTQAGRVVRGAQWVAYGDEALWYRSAARLLWGGATQADLSRLRKVVERGELRAYRPPSDQHIAPGHKLSVYFRHSQVLVYYRSLKEPSP